MRIKDIQPGIEYACVDWYSQSKIRTIAKDDGELSIPERFAIRELAESYSSTYRALVLEVGVQVRNAYRPGVLVQRLGRDGTPARRRDDAHPEGGELIEPEAIETIKVITLWAPFDAAYHERVALDAEEQAERARLKRIEKAAQRERNAAEWMIRQMRDGRHELETAAVVLAVRLLDGPEITDAEVREYVERRNPDGNPYLRDDDD